MPNSLSDSGRILPLQSTAGGFAKDGRLPALAVTAALAATGPCR